MNIAVSAFLFFVFSAVQGDGSVYFGLTVNRNINKTEF